MARPFMNGSAMNEGAVPASVRGVRTMRTRQVPIHSGFGAQTTAREVIEHGSLDGAVAVVTGGYVGISLATTRVLSDAGATVVVPARTPGKARAALAGMDCVELEDLDLSDPTSIDAFAARFLASGRPLHILVNNAGIMATPLVRDARGFESQLATNHIGHFQLSVRLWPALRNADGARVVSLSSRGHAIAAVDFDDPQFVQRPYDRWIAYGQSKTATALFAVALDARNDAEPYGFIRIAPETVQGCPICFRLLPLSGVMGRRMRGAVKIGRSARPPSSHVQVCHGR